MLTRIGPIHVLPLLCAALLSACSRTTEATQTKAGTNVDLAPRITVAVAKAGTEDLEQQEVVSAEFRPFQIIDVHSKVAGYLKKIYVDVGDRVKEGQVLAVLEVPELADDLSRANASKSHNVSEVQRAREELSRAQAQHHATHLTFERLQSVASTRPNLIAQQEIDDAQARDQGAEAGVSAAKAALAATQQTVDVSQADIERVRTMTDYTKITAPFAGIVTKRYADTGAMIPAGTATTSNGLALVQLSQNTVLRLVLPVPEAIASKIHLGQTVSVHVQGLNRDFQGKVARFADTVTTDTRTMDTQVDVPNPNLLLIPGMYAEAKLTVERRPGALSVPIEAITVAGNSATAYVVDASNHIAIRSLKIGLETPNRAEVLSGLSAGELVVIGNHSSLTAGQSVQPRLLAPSDAKGAE